MKTLTTVFGAIVLAAAPAAAFADSASEEITFAYEFDAAALTTEAGAQAAYQALVREAREACTLPGVRGIASVDSACVAELVDKAVASMGSSAMEVAFERSNLAELAPVAGTYSVATR